MGSKIRDIIDYYTGHDVSDTIRERVLERVSDACDRSEVDEALRGMWNKADSAYMNDEEITAAYNRIFATEESREEKKGRTISMSSIMRVAAVVVPLVMLVVFGKLYVGLNNQLNDVRNISMVQGHTINGETKSFALADGTRVRLNPSSVLLYPSSFKGADERKVFLSGEAFFDIRHDDAQPFHVSTPYFEITDLGTSFAVSSYTSDDEVSATLKSGKIELRIVGQEDRVYSLAPNDRLTYNVKTKAVSVRQVPEGYDGMSWRNKKIDLNDVSLQEAATIMGNAYGVKFRFLSNRNKSTKITIHFNRGETLKDAMSLISNLVPGLEYEITGDEVVVK